MSWEPMVLANVAADELGSDVAEIRLVGLLDDDEYHLPGAEILIQAGMAIAAAFCAGFILEILKELGDDWGREEGAGLARRFRRLVGRLIPGSEAAIAEPNLDNRVDLTVEFTTTVEVMRQELAEKHVEVSKLRIAASGSSAEVAQVLRDLGLHADRAEAIAPRCADVLLNELIDGAELPT